MDLIVADDDYCLKKLLIAAACAHVTLEVKLNASSEELEQLEPKAKAAVLITNSGNIGLHTSILRYLGGLSPASPLYGASAVETGQIDTYLELSWAELEVPLQTILACNSSDPSNPTFPLSLDVKDGLIEKCQKDIDAVLKVLDSHLSDKTFLVGERLSIADINLYAVIDALIAHCQTKIQSYPALFRYYLTIGSIPKVASVLPLPAPIKALTQEAPSSSSAAPPSPSIKPANGSSTASVVVSGKWDRHRVRIKELLANEAQYVNKTVTVKGWIRTTRAAEKGRILFVELSDGSTVKSLQLLLTQDVTVGRGDVDVCGGVGASLSVTGLVIQSPKEGQSVELHATQVQVLGKVYGGDAAGEVGAKNYPMSKKGHSLEFLREQAHLRPRSKVFSCAMRMRNAMAFATHKFFNERGFVYTHTPIITGADCEGAGEQFAVTSLLSEGIAAKSLPLDKNGGIDYSKDYFGRRCCLTVSGQLNVETHACALSDVYTFGPTFRAENSHTSRHLAEFWMIEPEICFADLADDMALAVRATVPFLTAPIYTVLYHTTLINPCVYVCRRTM